ncbi:MAG: tRNA (adenosine(37)-N6)-threonylcarbamoyltransferase complex dimerization subunit type 1 TsaB, partial [Actinobacteria bacterium]|nr:tRNA (adenosine(37)-N6)-threonylcarbamoyltransferase complex dimerization subunit type 1 TsaB [Actinomycetota bacterium]
GRRIAGPAVNVPADISPGDRPVAGEGGLLYPSYLPNGIGPAYPAATTLCRMVTAAVAAGDTGRLLPPEPLYLRRPDAREPGAPKRVSRS